jgi:hypothetical protein
MRGRGYAPLRFHQLQTHICEYVHMNNFKRIIDKAIERQTILEIEYKDKKNATTKRLMLPMYWDDDSVIVAFCFLREGDRHFNVNNIISATDVGDDVINHLKPSLHPRKVEFPTNKYFGELYVVEDLARTLLFPCDYEVNRKWGKVLVPPNKNLYLNAIETPRGKGYVKPNITILGDFQRDALQAFGVENYAYEMDLKNIQHFSDLKWVSLHRVSRKNLEDLCEIDSNLTYLLISMSEDQESVKGIKFISRFAGLKALEIGFFDLQDTDLTKLGNLERLEFITLSGNKEFKGIGLQFIHNKEKLFHLDVQSTNIDDGGVSEIVKFTNLKDLSLSHNKNQNLTRKGFEQLELLRNLQGLDLWDTNLDDDGFQKVCQLTNLVYLSIGMTKVSDKSIKFIDNLRNLKQLNVYDTAITAKSMEYISKLPNLEYFQVEDGKRPSKH